MAWATDLTDEEIDIAYEDFKDGFEPGFNMDDGADPEEKCTWSV